MNTIKASCLSCMQSFSVWIVGEFLPEVKCLLKLALPIILMNFFRFLNPTISVIMCGHLTRTEFDAASLANSLINVFGVSVDLGFSTACDTLFAQIYGSRNKRKLGLMLQKAILVMTITYVILACFHLNIEPFLIFLQQDVEISRLAANYVTIYLPGLFFDFQFLAISRYLQNQNVVYPMMISAGVGSAFNIIFQYIGIYVLDYGIEASAVVQAFSCFVMFSIQLIYVLWSKVYKPTWQGFEFLNALEGWGIFFKLGIPGIIMLGVEEWNFEIGNFIAGAMSDVQLGAQSIAFQIEALCYILHSGLAIAVAIRAGQFLGGNKPKEASLSAKVVIITDFGISIITATMLISLRNYLPYMFTNDEQIIELAKQIFYLLIAIQFFDAGCNSTAGIFRACGRQLRGAIVMFCSFYILGIPVGVILIFVVGMDIKGFWLGLICALAVEVTIYFILIFKIDWNYEAVKAQSICDVSSISDTHTDELLFENNSEFSQLIQSDNEIEEEIEQITVVKKQRKISKISGRRSISGITDVLIDSVKEFPSLRMSYKTKRKTIIKRIILLAVTLSLLIISILIKVYLPKSYYIPCITNQTSLSLKKHYPICSNTNSI